MGQIWLDDVRCAGTETRLIDCPANTIGDSNCGHHEDAGVSCAGPCPQGAIRLQGGTATAGRVEVCNNNVWGTVCDDSWGTGQTVRSGWMMSSVLALRPDSLTVLLMLWVPITASIVQILE